MSAPKGISKMLTGDLPELSKEDAARLNLVKNTSTTPRDERFPATNQALHCWNRYNEWLVCVQNGDEDNCKPLRQYSESICPSEWVEAFDEQREEGSFSGIGNKFAEMKKGHH